MKKINVYLIALLAAVMISSVSCKKTDDDPSTAGMISLFESDKLLVSIVAGSTSTGFGAVFENLITDSLERVNFCRIYVDPVRFFEDLSGYLFIQDFSGWNIVHPIDKNLEGTDLWDLQDAQGNFFVRDMSEIATTTGSGVTEYYWNNPTNGGIEKKLSYIHSIPGIEYYIGSGFYIRTAFPEITLLESNKEISRNTTISFAEGLSAVFTDIYTDSLDRVSYIC